MRARAVQPLTSFRSCCGAVILASSALFGKTSASFSQCKLQFRNILSSQAEKTTPCPLCRALLRSYEKVYDHVKKQHATHAQCARHLAELKVSWSAHAQTEWAGGLPLC